MVGLCGPPGSFRVYENSTPYSNVVSFPLRTSFVGTSLHACSGLTLVPCVVGVAGEGSTRYSNVDFFGQFGTVYLGWNGIKYSFTAEHNGIAFGSDCRKPIRRA